MNNELLINLYKHLLGLDEIFTDGNNTTLLFTVLIPGRRVADGYYRRRIKIYIIHNGQILISYTDGEYGYYSTKYNPYNRTFNQEITIYGKEYISSAIIARMNMYVKIFNAFRFGYYE